MGINMTKVCIKCKQTKSIAEFNKDKHKKDGLNSYCKSCKAKKDKSWAENNRDKVNKCISNWVSNNKEKHDDYQKQYRIDNQDKINEIAKLHQKKRRQDNKVKLHHSIRSRINERLKQIGTNKSKATLNIVGLGSWDELRKHIESQFTKGMNWDNYGNKPGCWSIDHIIPISSAKTEEDVYLLNNYTNLQPMWHLENIKKSNKIF
jgi:hypothetical protein